MTVAISNEFLVQVVSAAGAPQWVTDLTVGSGWTPIAGGTAWPGLASWQQGARISDQLPLPILDSAAFGSDHPSDIIKAWTGGCVDPVRREMLLVANGGHSSYVGNEAYALKLNQNTPAWHRLCDPTPNTPEWLNTGPIPTTFTVADQPIVHYDGRTRSMHTAGSPQYANGRVWFPIQTSCTNGSGTSGQGIISFDRDGVEQLPGDFAPWSSTDTFPYQTHGVVGLSGGQSGVIFGSSAYDPVDDRVWYYGQSLCWAVNASTGAVSVPPQLHGKNFTNTGFNGAWVVCLPDQRKVLIGLALTAGQPIWVHDLTKPFTDPNVLTLFTTANSAQNALTWDPDSYWYNWANPGVPNDGRGDGISTTYAVMTNPYHYDVFNYGLGAVYSNGLVYVGPTPCRFTGLLGGNVHVLDPSTMTWTVLANPGDRPTVSAGAPAFVKKVQTGNWGRFNIVEWGSARVLIHAADVYGPTHVWRIS